MLEELGSAQGAQAVLLHLARGSPVPLLLIQLQGSTEQDLLHGSQGSLLAFSSLKALSAAAPERGYPASGV